jgi:zinc/manganese transport system substrate-binding protein
MTTLLRWSALASASLFLTACSAPEPVPTTTDETDSSGSSIITLFATTTVVGSVVQDIATCVGNEPVAVEVLMPVGADPHDFAASSEQLALMSEGGVVVANGLHLEGGLSDALEQIEADGGTVLHVAEWVDPLPFGEHDDEHDHAEEEAGHDHAEEEAEHDHADEEAEHDHGEFDPHFWFDLSRMALVAEELGRELEGILGDASPSCGETVAQEILATEEEVVAILSVISDDDRVLVTDHDAFGYFAAAYDFDIAGVVIPGGSTLAEPSSAELAALVATIEELGIPALMGNVYEQSDLMEAVAQESGSLTVVPLYVGSVGGPGSGAEDYQSMMLTNAQLIADALGGTQ